MDFRTINPVWGLNYRRGSVGFVFKDKAFVSNGIVYFERWDRGNMPPVSHTLVVSGTDECIEANAPGVQRASLRQYFEDPEAHIFFRQPRGLDDGMADVIVATAQSHIGHKYDFALIGADALAGSFLGYWLNHVTNNWPNRVVSWMLNSSSREICSELVAMSLQAVPALHGLGCLKLPARMITPQKLVGDEEIFSPMQQIYP